MAESFEVPLVEDEKFYIPDPSYKQQAWTKDYTATYREYLADKEGFGKAGKPSRVVPKVG
jgi:acetyl-CoA synthetase